MSSRTLTLAVAVPVLFASCTKKEPPPPPPPTTVATTLPPTTTTTLAPAPTPAPTPPPVWREARWGMTPAEVLAAFKGEARKLPQPDRFAEPQHGSSVPAGAGDVAIPSYEADGATFKVLFGFDKNALDRIHLSAHKPIAGTCGFVEGALSQRLATTPTRKATGSSLRGEEITWRRADQTVVLSCAGVASLGFLTVSVDFLSPVAAAAP
ncbi:MAG: hypothetical protein ABW221_26195 [Vicinamibacteria bacterium]